MKKELLYYTDNNVEIEIEVAPIIGYTNYFADKFGNIYSVRGKKAKCLKPKVKSNGYCSVQLSKNNKIKECYVHRIVWEAWNTKIPTGLVINHRNEIKTNNRLDNLEVCTIKENCNYGTRNKRISEARKKYWERKKQAS